MTKQEFLSRLAHDLYTVDENNLQKYIDYYSEMIDDRIEDGMSEEEAVNSVGDPSSIAKDILIDYASLPKLVKEKLKPKHKLRVWEIILIVLGSPVWLPLLCAAVIVFLAVYIVIWSCVIALYAVDISLVGSFACFVYAVVYTAISGNMISMMFSISMLFMSLGGAVLMFFVCKLVTKVIVKVSKAILRKVKSIFVKEN